MCWIDYFLVLGTHKNYCKLPHPALPVLLTNELEQSAAGAENHWGQSFNACSGII